MTGSLIGKVMGRCRVVRQLGRGGMSTIYLAHQESVGRDVVLKVLSPTLLDDTTFIKRFTREVETTAALQHPHIIPLYDHGVQDDLPYIVMAYIPGGSLKDLIAVGAMKPGEIARVVDQVALALDYAHEHGVIHRDIKPANILLDRQRNAILSDFGIAKVIADTQTLTQDAIVGTFAYLAPEMIAPTNPITPAVDVYSLAVTIYQMLTGELPFKGDSSAEMMWAHVNRPAPLITAGHPELPPALDAVLQKALAKSPLARYRSVGELAKDLRAVTAGRKPEVADADLTPTVLLGPSLAPASRLEDAVKRTIDQVVKITLPGGGSGSGIYLPGAQIMTCLHVVDGEAGVGVHFRTGEQIEADVVATDHKLDLALLKLRKTPGTLTPKQLGGILHEVSDPKPGEVLAAIGHPLGLDWSVTGGHFNAVRRPGEAPLPEFGIALDTPLVQVDVTINAGNSGGPLLDAGGRLVGLADSIINPALANNIGFAIMASTVWDFWKEHREAVKPLVAYNCNHHHPADQTYCPLTGKPIEPLEPVPMPAGGGVRYSCGHVHPPGLAYCPLIGKPAHPVDENMTETQVDAPKTEAHVTCTNCGHLYPVGLSHCPQCGKPRKE
jgi:S1-C subfamily serine protease/tRNA A-37 threonylcarbamoyl transferase component Bud32